MKFWIAVVIFCNNEQCAFWKGSENYYSEQECNIAAISFMKKADAELPLEFIQGVCLPVTSKDQI
jgi:hypothetical protein